MSLLPASLNETGMEECTAFSLPTLTQPKCFQNPVAKSIPLWQQTRIFNSSVELFTLLTNNRYICRSMSYYSNTFVNWPSALLPFALHVLPCCINKSPPPPQANL